MSRGKKLLLVTSHFRMGWGGISSYAYDMIEAIGLDFEITVITGDDGDYKPERCKEVICFNMANLSIDNAKCFLKLIDTYSADVIINSNCQLFALITPFISDKTYVIAVSHFVNGPLAWAAGYNAQYADKIISLSSFGKQYLESKFKIAVFDKVCVIPNFAETTHDTKIEKSKNSVLNIVYPGGCSYAKSAEVVCHALLKLLENNVEFNLYWLGKTKVPGGRFPLFRVSAIEDIFPKDDRIKYIGQIERKKARKILDSANIFLLPSRGEGFPISLIEAMSSACIAIVSDAKHGSLDIIKDNENGIIVHQGSVDDLYTKIYDVITNHQKYVYLYSGAENTYKSELTKDIWENKMKNIFNDDASHDKRHEFSAREYKRMERKYSKDMKLYFIKDRCIQLYHFLYFKLLFIKYNK